MEINDNTQNLSNGQEQENNINENDNQKEEGQINNTVENNKMLNENDLNTLTVDKLKEELKNRKIDFPKNAKKKDLIDLLLNSK